jgi:hypothetical protein
MDLLLRFLNLRSFLIAGGIIAFVVLADRFQEYPRGWYENRLNARERGTSPLGGAIAQDLEARESARLKALHRTVSEEIAAAQAKGFAVGRLQAVADKALALDTPRFRPAAMERLNQLRLVIPQAKEPFQPAVENDDAADIPAAPKPSSSRRGKTK